LSAPSTGEKSVIGNDLKIMGQGLKGTSKNRSGPAAANLTR
jgi:hypothetical protein